MVNLEKKIEKVADLIYPYPNGSGDSESREENSYLKNTFQDCYLCAEYYPDGE